MLNDGTPEFRTAKHELESALYDMKCIGRTLVMLTEGAGAYSDVFSFLGCQLLDAYDAAGDAFNAIICPDKETPSMPVEPAEAAQ